MTGKLKLIWDGDYIKYMFASAGEKRTIRVTHPSGIDEEFKTRTEFYGHWQKKAGGWLAEYNTRQHPPLLPEEFTITDIQTAEPIEFVLASVKTHIRNICEKFGTDDYQIYLGKGDSFRVELSTLLKYKGQRKDMLKPLLLGEVEQYLVKYHKAEFVEHLETDDKVVMDCWRNPNNIAIIVEKDYYGVNELVLYNSSKDELTKTGKGLGRLEDKKTKIAGYGRLFHYWQCLSGDDSDNYKANCFSEAKWGDKSAYTALSACKTDKEALQCLVNCYKQLYPEKKIVTGWRGNEIEIDWYYVMEENFNLSRMRRFEGDDVNLKDVLDKLGVDYE